MELLNVMVSQTPGKIECNFDEIEAALKIQMTAYEELEVTEDNIPERKADVATLRKIKSAVDDERKRVKKAYNVPLDEFEKRVKGLTAIIDKAVKGITDQLDDFEKKRREEKKSLVLDIYENEIGECREFLPFASVFQERWLNKTCGDNEIVSAIQERKLKVKGDLALIRGMKSEIEERLISSYRTNGGDLAAVVKMNSDYMEAKRIAEETLRNQERLRRMEEERAQAASQTAQTEPIGNTASEVFEAAQRAQAEANEPSITVRVKGKDNIEMLISFLDSNWIEYEEV